MSLKQIAQMTGLSTATVSHVLTGKRAVSAESRVKVLEAAAQIGYRPNLAARMLRTQRSNTIAVVLPGEETNRNASYYYMDVIAGIRKKLKETDYDLIVSNYGEESIGERSLRGLQVFRKQWVDGIIVVPSSRNPNQLVALKEMGVPFVLIDRRVDAEDYSSVDSNNEKGAYEAVKLLAESGKKRIGFIGGALTISTGTNRYQGYKRAMEELGLGYNEDLVVFAKHFGIAEGSSYVSELLEKGIDGLFVSDNVLTMGVVVELNKRGIKIPEELGIIGFDDFDWMDMITPPLTTVKQQSYQMGYIAAEMIMRKLAGIDINERIVLDTSIVIRSSHGEKSLVMV